MAASSRVSERYYLAVYRVTRAQGKGRNWISPRSTRIDWVMATNNATKMAGTVTIRVRDGKFSFALSFIGIRYFYFLRKDERDAYFAEWTENKVKEEWNTVYWEKEIHRRLKRWLFYVISVSLKRSSFFDCKLNQIHLTLQFFFLFSSPFLSYSFSLVRKSTKAGNNVIWNVSRVENTRRITHQIGRYVSHTFYRESFNEWLKGSDSIACSSEGEIGQEHPRNVARNVCDPFLPRMSR